MNVRVDLDDEFAFHVDMLVHELTEAGWSPAAARAEAERRFGAVGPVWDACVTIDERRHRRAALADRMSALIQDVRYALRSIRLTPGFSFVVAVTLALGIGATTTMYSIVDGVLLRPLPYPGAERLVTLQTKSASSGDATNISFPEYLDWKKRTTEVFAEVGTWFQVGANLTVGGQTEALLGERMSASVPRLLGVKPVLGRFFVDAEDGPTAPRVVVLSEGLWRRRFGADRTIVGRSIEMSGRATTVIGVFPALAAARLPNELARGREGSYWIPLRIDETSAPRGLHFMYAAAKLRDGVSFARGDAALQIVARNLVAERVTAAGIVMTPMAELMVRDARRPLLLLLGAVGLLLLISCANVANLLLARAAARQREFAVRIALGAGRSRLVSQLLAESVVRAFVGGALGVGLTLGAWWVLRHELAVKLPRFELIAIDGRVLVFALAISVITGLLFGVVPAVRASGEQMSETLKEGSRGLSGSVHHDRVRRVLMVAEIGLSFVLLVQAGLLIRSLHNVLSVPKGFDSASLLSASVALPATNYPDDRRRLAFFNELQRELDAIPGSRGAALASSLPIEGGVNGNVGIEGRTFTESTSPVVEKRIVSKGYFELLGARLVAGRFFATTDIAGASAVAIVNEAFAKKWFPRETAVGKRIDFSWNTQGLQTIVGVVGDVLEGDLDKPSPPAVYVPFAQRPHDYMAVLVRASAEPSTLGASIEAAVRRIDSKLPVTDIRTFDAILASATAGQRLTTSILAVFATIALLLAAVGLYGVISYSVAQRTRELGIRSALGAQRADIMRLVLGQSASLTAVGMAIGIAAALGASRLIANQLFGVGAADGVTFTVVAGTLATVALMASVIPATRATRIDPLAALRRD